MPKHNNVLAGMARDSQRREMRRVIKNRRPNRDERSPRRRDWDDLAHADETWDARHTRERVMPPGERERRRTIEKQMFETEDRQAQDTDQCLTDGAPGLVIEVSTGLCRVQHGRAATLCSLRGSLTAAETGYTNVVAVGDRVLISQNGSEQGVVERVLPRRNRISRPDPFYSHLQQVLVANVDQLLVVASWRDPHLWPELVDRYLIAAERSDVTPVLCINKVDLAESPAEAKAFAQLYRGLGYRVILTSAHRGDGIDQLQALLTGQVTVLAGLSGVGKSSLLRAVQPDLDLRIGEVNPDRHQGRHTTSQATMFPLGQDGYVIDTPGIREFGLVGLTQADLIAYYPDLADAVVSCQFSNCTHRHEPGCAVRLAVRRGDVSQSRYDSYQKIRSALPEQP